MTKFHFNFLLKISLIENCYEIEFEYVKLDRNIDYSQHKVNFHTENV